MTNEEMISLLEKARDWVDRYEDGDNRIFLLNSVHNIRCCIKELRARQKERKWHTVDEEPWSGEQLLCKTKEGGYIVLSEDDAWLHNTDIYHIKEWCYLDELLNEH